MAHSHCVTSIKLVCLVLLLLSLGGILQSTCCQTRPDASEGTRIPFVGYGRVNGYLHRFVRPISDQLPYGGVVYLMSRGLDRVTERLSDTLLLPSSFWYAGVLMAAENKARLYLLNEGFDTVKVDLRARKSLIYGRLFDPSEFRLSLLEKVDSVITDHTEYLIWKLVNQPVLLFRVKAQVFLSTFSAFDIPIHPTSPDCIVAIPFTSEATVREIIGEKYNLGNLEVGSLLNGSTSR